MFTARLYLPTYSERELMPAVFQWNYGKAMAAITTPSSHFLTLLGIHLPLMFPKLSVTHPGPNVWQCFLLLRLVFEKESNTLQYPYMCISVHTYMYTHTLTHSKLLLLLATSQ